MENTSYQKGELREGLAEGRSPEIVQQKPDARPGTQRVFFKPGHAIHRHHLAGLYFEKLESLTSVRY